MSEHRAHIDWERESEDFRYDSFNRTHVWSFEGGQSIEASAAAAYQGDRERIDPEEAFVAAIASCHMLTFLSVAARKRLVVDRYRDDAVGKLADQGGGALAVTQVVLRPRIDFTGKPPSAEELARLHELAHKHCFIANSVTTEIRVEPA